MNRLVWFRHGKQFTNMYSGSIGQGRSHLFRKRSRVDDPKTVRHGL